MREREDTVDFLKRNGREPIPIEDLTAAVLNSENESDLDKQLLAIYNQDSPELIDLLTETFYYAASKGALFGNPDRVEPTDLAVKKSDVDFSASVARLKNRVAVTKFYFEELPKQTRSLAFYVSNLEKLREIELIKTSLNNAIAKGDSFKTWRDNLDLDSFNNLSKAQQQVVYRNNVNTVYNQSARYNAGTSEVTPYLMYTAVGDDRTRASHQELDGTVKKADDAFWDTYMGPWAHNCRCSAIPLSGEDAKEIGISRKRKFPDVPEGFGKSGYGDILSGTKDATQAAMKTQKFKRLPNQLKSRFKDSIDNINDLVDIWYIKNQNIFK